MKKFFNRVVLLIPAGLFIIIFLLMSIQVFTRYLMGFTLSWNIELCRYSFVWLTFVGAAYVRKENSHVKIDFMNKYLITKMSQGTQKVFWITKQLITITYLIVVIILGFFLAYNSRLFLSQAMQISQFFLYISVSIGMAFYLIIEIQDAIKYIIEK